MLSEREKAARCALFDSFCHTILRNAIRDYNKHNAIKDRLEILTDDPESLLEIEQFSEDDHPSSHLYISYCGNQYQLDYEPLYLAMKTLLERELGVLILDFWLEWKDARIAQVLGVTDRTVRNIRSRALEKIRKWFSLTRGMP